MPKPSLGKGLSSLIPNKIKKEVLPKTSPVYEGLGDRIMNIAVERIDSNPHQPRKNFSPDDLEELAQSIQTYGILQPLVVRKKNDRYELIVGERRLRAAKIAGLSEVPAIVRDAESQEQIELALLENIQRRDLNPIEEAIAYRRLIDEFNLTLEDLAKRIGKSRPVISNMMRILQLPEDMQKALIDGKISYSIARVLVGLNPDEQRALFSKAVKNHLTVFDVEQEAKKYLPHYHRRQSPDARIAPFEEKLQEALRTKVVIRRPENLKRGGKIIFYFYSDDEFYSLIRKILREDRLKKSFDDGE